ncbi:MAG: hypothetical protein AAGB04_05480 [Pseudomonadota bacterium]
MAEWLTGGYAINGILVVIALEALALALLFRLFGIGPGLTAIIFNLLAGACLLLALRTALVSGNEVEIAVFLTGSFVAHLLDLRSRWTANN